MNMINNKDIWSYFEYEPRFHTLIVTPEQKKVVVFDVKENVFYFNQNPHGEGLNKKIKTINQDKKTGKLILDIENTKPISIKNKNSVGKILVDILLNLTCSNFEVSNFDKDHIQLTFLNNILYLLDIRKYDKDVIINNLTLLFEENQLFITFNGPKVLVNKINILNGELLIETPFNEFKFTLNTQSIISDYLKLLLIESTDQKQVKLMVSNDEKIEIPFKQTNNILNYYWQIQYHPYYNCIFFSLNKTTFFYLLNKGQLLILADEFGVNEFSLISELQFKNNEIFINLENNKILNFTNHNGIDKVVYQFLTSIKNRKIDIDSTSYNTFTFISINGILNQFRIMEVNNKEQVLLNTYQLFANNAKLISNIKETNGLETLMVKIVDNTIQVKTKNQELKFDLTMPKIIFELLRDLINEGVR